MVAQVSTPAKVGYIVHQVDDLGDRDIVTPLCVVSSADAAKALVDKFKAAETCTFIFYRYSPITIYEGDAEQVFAAEGK